MKFLEWVYASKVRRVLFVIAIILSAIIAFVLAFATAGGSLIVFVLFLSAAKRGETGSLKGKRPALSWRPVYERIGPLVEFTVLKLSAKSKEYISEWPGIPVSPSLTTPVVNYTVAVDQLVGGKTEYNIKVFLEKYIKLASGYTDIPRDVGKATKYLKNTKSDMKEYLEFIKNYNLDTNIYGINFDSKCSLGLMLNLVEINIANKDVLVWFDPYGNGLDIPRDFIPQKPLVRLFIDNLVIGETLSNIIKTRLFYNVDYAKDFFIDVLHLSYFYKAAIFIMCRYLSYGAYMTSSLVDMFCNSVGGAKKVPFNGSGPLDINMLNISSDLYTFKENDFGKFILTIPQISYKERDKLLEKYVLQDTRAVDPPEKASSSKLEPDNAP